MPRTITARDSAPDLGRLPAIRWEPMSTEPIDFAADGVPLAELHRTTQSGTLMFLPADKVVGGSERYSAAEVAELSGIEFDFLIRVLRAMGLPVPDPDEPVLTEAALEAARLIGAGRAEGIPDEDNL